MKLTRLPGFSLIALAVLAGGLGGCASSPGTPGAPDGAPRGYRPLGVGNGDFVEAVHFCDFYRARRLGGANGWARVFQWGGRDGDFMVRSGRAVAVYEADGRLRAYDVDKGFFPLATPVAGRSDPVAVAPQILANHPQMKEAVVRYLEPGRPSPEPKGPDYTRGATTQALHDALRVATTLGAFRPVRVVEFIAPEDSYLRPSAATVFTYGRELCLYSSATGTRVKEAPGADITDLAQARALVLAVFPDAQDVKWFQPARAVVVR